MRKILVLSDSHGRFEKFLKAYEIEEPDIVVFCGDGARDIEDFLYLYDDIEHYEVRGNCDFFSSLKDDCVFFIEDYKFFLTHGHFYNVKRSLENIKKILKETDINVILYGHTHRQHKEIVGENKIIFNPGSIKDGDYGVIIIDEKKKIEVINKKI